MTDDTNVDRPISVATGPARRTALIGEPSNGVQPRMVQELSEAASGMA